MVFIYLVLAVLGLHKNLVGMETFGGGNITQGKRSEDIKLNI